MYRLIVIGFLLLIIASLASSMVFLLRNKGDDNTRTVKALTIRVGLSVGLFLLLMAGFYFEIIPKG